MADTGAGEKLKVFISYSRRDSASFADELMAGLEVAGFAPFLDRFDIAAGEEWEARLGGLISQSDTVVFVISPEAVKSEQCTREVDRTLALSKRLLPVVFKKVPERDVPEKLRRLQWIHFDGQPGFTRPLLQLAEALRVDLHWIRDHTRLAELATHWDGRGRPESLLLRADDLAEVQKWMAARKAAAPEITEVQRAFIKASEQAETTRLGNERAQLEVIRNAQEARAKQQKHIAWLLGGLAVLVGVSILGIIAWINESRIQQAWTWYWKGMPYRNTNFDKHKYVLTAAQERALKRGDSFRECAKDCPWMIVVPEGEFMMGSPVDEKGRDPNEGPQHLVRIARPFAVSKYDVTFDDWDACVKVGGCPREGGANDNSWGRRDRPVINVNWDDAQAYVAWLRTMTGKKYRLLSEAEWEYAARAGTKTAFYWGDEIDKQNANCHRCETEWSGRRTSPVGSYKDNPWGLFDMAGNVWQWVQDCWHEDYNGAPTDGRPWETKDCEHRVVRGGSWYYYPADPRSAYRYGDRKDDRNYNTGFRVGRTLTR
jgi:formylglycine-generating enzyme required for sulfatase activity